MFWKISWKEKKSYNKLIADINITKSVFFTVPIITNFIIEVCICSITLDVLNNVTKSLNMQIYYATIFHRWAGMQSTAKLNFILRFHKATVKFILKITFLTGHPQNHVDMERDWGLSNVHITT